MTKNDYLVFIDTNIFLDFYRIRKSDVSLSYLESIEKIKDRLISSSQVEMEYKKNRQVVILETLNQYKNPNPQETSSPAILAEYSPTKAIEKKKKEISAQHTKIKEKIIKVLSNPSQNDKVYQTLQRLLKHKSPYILSRPDKRRFELRELAQKRFYLGYPPRKPNDNSIGDSFHWEWIIRCAEDSGKNVIIASRDGDFGKTYGDQSYLNDWLNQEFKERVGRKRKIILTDKLSYALKIMKQKVSEEMVLEEKRIIKRDIASIKNNFSSEDQFTDYFSKYLQTYLKNQLLDEYSPYLNLSTNKKP